MKLFYMYNNPDKKILQKYKDKYYGVMIPAHIGLQFQPPVQDVISTTGKPYIVDPVTNRLATSISTISKIDKSSNTEQIKKSFEKIIKAYGLDFLLKRDEALTVEDFENGIVNEEKFVKKVISLQNTLISNILPSQQQLQKYLKFLKKPVPQRVVSEPIFYIPPYFYFESLDDLWYILTVELSNIAKTLTNISQLCPLLSISKDLLKKEVAYTILEDFGEFSRYIIHINDFDEKHETTSTLKSLARFVEILATSNKEVYLEHTGGFFALLLHYFGISGIITGIDMGEHKDIFAPSRGWKVDKLYVPLVHTRLPKIEVKAFYKKNLNLICRCNICKKKWEETKENVITFVDSFSYLESKAHFVEARFQEKESIENSTIGDVINMLQQEKIEAEKSLITLYSKTVSSLDYFDKWIQVLKEKMENKRY